MSVSDLISVLSITGPLLATVGAAFLAYDAMQGPMRVHILRDFKKRIAGAVWKHRYLSSTYPSPPYTPEEASSFKAELDKDRDEELSRIEAEAEESDLNYRLLVSNLAFWGFLLVAFGSLAQAVAAWLA